MKLLVEIPMSYPEERDYILEVMLHEFLGLDYQVQRSNRRNVQITADDEPELVIHDHLFQTPKDCWLTEQSLPRQPLKTWDTSGNLAECSGMLRKVPVIYGDDLSDGEFFQSGS